MLLADFFMVVTGYIGEQQLTAAGEIITSQKLLWGAISTVGYVVAIVALYGLHKRFAGRGNDTERWGFKFIGITTVTTWGVYPLGHMLTMTSINLNYIHLTFSIFDVFNKVGISVVAYLVGKRLLDERLNEKKVLAATPRPSLATSQRQPTVRPQRYSYGVVLAAVAVGWLLPGEASRVPGPVLLLGVVLLGIAHEACDQYVVPATHPALAER